MAASPPHVLMMPYPLHGHSTPLLYLAKLLAARNFAITFVTGSSKVKKLLSTAKLQELNKQGIKLLGISDGFTETHEHEVMLEPEDFIASLDCLHRSFEELVRKMVEEEGLAITCIISDSFLIWTQDVANKWRIPRVSFWPNSLASLACSYSLPKIRAASPSLNPFSSQVYENGEGEQLHCIPGISQINACMLPFYSLDGDRSEQWMRHHIPTQMERVNELLCIVCNSFPDLEKEVHTHLKELLPCTPVFTLGPLFLSGDSASEAPGESDRECIQWLDTQQPRSVIYVCFGSVAILQEADIREIALGLEASQQPFLWVLRVAPCEAALKWFSEGGRARGKVIRWAPQVRVLSHEAVGGFLTHCGWNSTLESVCKGMPVIACPQMLDQRTNCWFLVEKEKVGVRLEVQDGGSIGRTGVEMAIRRLMQEEQGRFCRARASELARLAHSALNSSLPSHVDSLVQHILSSKTKPPSHDTL